MTDRFSVCLPFTLAQECPDPANWSDPKNFSNDKHDPGGETMCGIIQREYDQYRKSENLVCRDVRLCTEEEGQVIYTANYWLPHCDSLPPGLDLQFFDAAVNMGCFEAVKILQHILDITVDGSWGPKTAAEVADVMAGGAVMRTQVIREFTARRQAVYKMMTGYKYFGTDWERRATEIGAEALKMAGN